MLSCSEKILQLMSEKELSYSELSKESGIPKSALQRYATGETRKIPFNRIEILSKVFGVSPTYLMGWQEKEYATGQDRRREDGLELKQENLTAKERAIIEAYRSKIEMQPAIDQLLGITKKDAAALMRSLRGEITGELSVANFAAEKKRTSAMAWIPERDDPGTEVKSASLFEQAAAGLEIPVYQIAVRGGDEVIEINNLETQKKLHELVQELKQEKKNGDIIPEKESDH